MKQGKDRKKNRKKKKIESGRKKKPNLKNLTFIHILMR